ncbi:XTP/dITP diphosphatase [Lapidilactobacillus luobeiensis]|uniref:XTP/dITP diphosphatase n=1 Tax=Lapidilactobacillus luobeiensis TaxID=2950371 RepID=UPI0021C2A7A2|nr:XTP/dITP diphosphatase [Lapidilactobacillus luobeiensis]
MQHELVIATNNPGKAREFKAIFTPAGWQVKTLADFSGLSQVAETGRTFEDNARLKADHFAQELGQVVLADDSGLQVQYLHGQPGIFSARYAGRDHDDAANNARLLAELGGVDPSQRQANFHSTLVLAWPGRPATDLVVAGDVPGEILAVPRGEDGFGYDPLFFLPELAKTFAQLTPTEKNKFSHRGLAIRNLMPLWQTWWQEQEQK